MGEGFSERAGPAPAGPAIWSKSSHWEEHSIPPRPWLAQGYFLRGAVTTLVGPSGVSKSSLVLAWAVSLALGRQFHAMRPRDQFRSVIYNVEDDAEEQERRLSAVLTSLGRVPADVADRVLRTGPTKTGALFERDAEDGELRPTRAMVELERDLVDFSASAVFVDPLAELHGVEENDNTGMRAVVAEFRALAIRCNVAVVIIHHTRKGPPAPGDPEAGRGASSIVGASRVVLTISPMAKEDAQTFGLLEGSHRHFLRLDGGKANYSSLTECEWFERVAYTLANGDAVAAVVPWSPPKDTITTEAQAKVEGAIKRGHASGPLSPQLGNTARSVKHAMVEAGITTRPGQREMLTALTRDGFVQVAFKDARRKFALGLRSPDGLPEAEWADQGSSEPAEGQPS